MGTLHPQTLDKNTKSHKLPINCWISKIKRYQKYFDFIEKSRREQSTALLFLQQCDHAGGASLDIAVSGFSDYLDLKPCIRR